MKDAPVHFSVPEDVETAFDQAFKGRNKSAAVAESMRVAVERVRRKQKSREAIERIPHLDTLPPPVCSMRAAARRQTDPDRRVAASPSRWIPPRNPIAQAGSTENAATLRFSRLNSTPIRWIGCPRWRYLSA